MADETITIRQHTVPKSYLARFAKNENVMTVKLPGDIRFLQSIENASVRNRFYSIPGHPEGEDVFERKMGVFEGKAKQLFDKIEQCDAPLAFDERIRLGTFMVLQHLRGPDQRDAINATRKFIDLLFGNGSNFCAPSVDHVNYIITSGTEIICHLLSRPMSVIHFSEPSLITSDTPVRLVPWPDGAGGGFTDVQSILLPLGRKTGVLFDNIADGTSSMRLEDVILGHHDTVQTGTSAYRDFFNGCAIWDSYEYLYHHPDDEHLIPNRLPHPGRPLPTTTG